MIRAVDELIGDSQLLFFDELHVHDSGDARLLTQLLERVFSQRIVVLATSNYAPHQLLPDPIWHHIFEPGIALIQRHMDIHHLDGPTDYRSLQRDHTTGFSAGRWTTTLPDNAPGPAETTTVRVGDREFAVLAARPGELWMTFAQLCDSPTSTIEYLEWARTYTTWTVTDVPSFHTINPQAQQRLINLVDVLTNADTPTTFVSHTDLADFLDGSYQRPDAFRMASRLHLLQTCD